MSTALPFRVEAPGTFYVVPRGVHPGMIRGDNLRGVFRTSKLREAERMARAPRGAYAILFVPDP